MASNVESFTCLWLDNSVDSTEDNIETQQKLREIINELRTYVKLDTCEQYIRQVTNENIVLIVSGALGRELVPRVHDLHQLSSFYVYCQDKGANEKWAKNYTKVEVFVLFLMSLILLFFQIAWWCIREKSTSYYENI